MDNIFTRGDTGNLADWLDRKENSFSDAYNFESKRDIDIDGLPTRVRTKASGKPIDEIFHPNDDWKPFNAYLDTPVTDEALGYFKNNPNVTSVDFNVSYPGFTNNDYHPYSTSDLSDGFVSSPGELTSRSPIFAGSLKDRIKNVNEVIDANPDKYDPSGFVDNKAYPIVAEGADPKYGVADTQPATRRINFTPEDSKNLSTTLNEDLSRMMSEAPAGTTFVNNPDTPSRGKLYSRAANFSSVDPAGNQFVRRGERGSLAPLQITDSSAPALGPSNFNTQPGPIRTVREMISPDSVDEIKNLPKFQRGLYEKPTVNDLAQSTIRFADSPEFKSRLKTGLKGGLSVGLTDLIPSAEVVRTASQKGLREGAQQFVQEAAMGIPTGAAVGATTAAVPAIAPFVPGVAGGIMITEGARTLNEVTRATTGESLLSKTRQTLGTAPRTGNSSPNNSVIEKNQRRMDRVKNPPQIKPATSVPTPTNDLPIPELGRRVRMASQRFNPAKLEFGITELLFGR